MPILESGLTFKFSSLLPWGSLMRNLSVNADAQHARAAPRSTLSGRRLLLR